MSNFILLKKSNTSINELKNSIDYPKVFLQILNILNCLMMQK